MNNRTHSGTDSPLPRLAEQGNVTSNRPGALMRNAVAGAAVLGMLVLSGCGSGTDGGSAESAGSPVVTASSAPATTSARATATVPTTTGRPAAVVTGEGEPFEVYCSSRSDVPCMTVTISNIRWGEPCDRYAQYLKNGNILALDVVTEVPDSVTSEFTSPFRSFPWSVRSSDGQVSKVQNELCDSSALDVMQEMPGSRASATIYLDAPADVDAVVFDARNTPLQIFEVDPQG
jgi:hypothetical protein